MSSDRLKNSQLKSTSMQNLSTCVSDLNNNATNKSNTMTPDSKRRDSNMLRQKQTSFQSMMRSYSSLSLLMREPPKELIGCRIVRGPNWKWGRQDGMKLVI